MVEKADAIKKANSDEGKAQASLSAAHLKLADSRRAVLEAKKNGSDAAISAAQSAIKPLEKKVGAARKIHDEASVAVKAASKLRGDE